MLPAPDLCSFEFRHQTAWNACKSTFYDLSRQLYLFQAVFDHVEGIAVFDGISLVTDDSNLQITTLPLKLGAS